MIDEIYDCGYQAARTQLNAITGAASRIGKSVLDAFSVLNRIEYAAPWTSDHRKPRCN